MPRHGEWEPRLRNKKNIRAERGYHRPSAAIRGWPELPLKYEVSPVLPGGPWAAMEDEEKKNWKKSFSMATQDPLSPCSVGASGTSRFPANILPSLIGQCPGITFAIVV